MIRSKNYDIILKCVIVNFIHINKLKFNSYFPIKSIKWFYNGCIHKLIKIYCLIYIFQLEILNYFIMDVYIS